MGHRKSRSAVTLLFVGLLCSTGLAVALGQTQIGRVQLAQVGLDDIESPFEPGGATTDENPFANPAPLHSTEEPAPAAPMEVPPAVQLTPEDSDRGWLQAGNGPTGLSEPSRRHILFVTPDGRARGRISLINPATHVLEPVRELSLTFFTPEGSTAFEAAIESSGVFELVDVPEGVYAVIGSGPTAFMAFAVQTIRADGIIPVADWSFDGAALPKRDFPALDAILAKSNGSDSPFAAPLEPAPQEIPEEAGGLGGWIPNDAVDLNNLATPIHHHQVFLQKDGRLLGRLRKLHPVTGRPLIARNLNVYAILNGELVESTSTSEIGTFAFETLTPGVYSLVAEGSDGFIAFSFDAQPHAAAQAAEEQDVAVQIPNLEIDAAAVSQGLIQRELLNQTRQQGVPLGIPPGAPPQTAGGGGGGAFGGGTDGFGGGGGFGSGSSGLIEALAAAGLIAAGIAAADDDDNNQPASPSVPGVPPQTDAPPLIPPVF